MSRIVLLDSGPLGLLSDPKPMPRVLACGQWVQALLASGSRVLIPEIADYEVRRELVRTNKMKGLAELDALTVRLEYIRIETPMMRRAAELWAQARKRGQPTAGNRNIDADVILAAQALSLGDPNVIVATTNVAHLSRYVVADLWENIPTI